MYLRLRWKKNVSIKTVLLAVLGHPRLNRIKPGLELNFVTISCHPRASICNNKKYLKSASTNQTLLQGRLSLLSLFVTGMAFLSSLMLPSR